MIYFDNSATTKPCAEALDAINEVLTENWGNPSSAHRMGLSAHTVMEDASKQVALSLGVKRVSDGRVIFTSGGTEANNLAILGTVRAKARPEKNGRRGTVIITDGEHSSVDATCEKLRTDGFNVLKIPTPEGKLDLEWLEKNVTGDVIIASIMLVNNETGAVYDVKKASSIIRKASPAAVIHSDCVQAYLKMRFTPADIGADMVSVSAHKVFSAKGAGALCITKDIITSKKLSPVVFGGGQEDGFRSGTEGVPAIAGFAAAAKKGFSELKERIEKTKALSDYAVGKLSSVEGVRLNLPENKIPNIINLTVGGIKSETMLNFLSGEGICVSKSSACSTHSRNLSRALIAYGLSEGETDTSLRISFSHLNTADEVDAFASALEKGITSLAKIRR